MRATNVNGASLYFRFAGRPAGDTLVFINSLGTDWRVWESVARRFGEQCRLLHYDKRGHGLSDVPPGPLSIDDHVADLAALLEELDITHAVVCGLSVGGMIAIGLAARHPQLVRGLVLADTGHKIGDERRWNERIEKVRERGMGSIADGVLETWFSASFRSRRPAEAGLWRNMLVRTPVEGYTATCAALRDADLTRATQSIAAPALCLCGAEDLSTPPSLMRELSDLIPDGRFREVTGAAHLSTVENPGAVADLVGEHIRELGFG